MKTPIIEIPRASESTINALINAGILEVTENGIKVEEKISPAADQSNAGLITKLHRDYITEKEDKQWE